MVRIVLIHPGSTDYDAQGRIQGTLDMPLNDIGRQEVLQLVEALRLQGMEVLYASESEPSQETATTLAAGLGIKVKTLGKMHNLDHGLWQGMLVDEVKLKQPKVYRQWLEQPECVRPPEGETVGEARERVQTSLRKLLKKHEGDVIGLVVPDPLARVVRSYLLNAQLGDLWHATDEHGHWETINVEPNVVVTSIVPGEG
jgi:broad specificity phosphatase PhoE